MFKVYLSLCNKRAMKHFLKLRKMKILSNKGYIEKIIEVPLRELQTGKALTNDISVSHCCALCGKKLKKEVEYKMIHLLTNGNIVSHSSEDIDNSQGFFPVGNECVKRLAIKFAF
jgi:hypothetical protein